MSDIYYHQLGWVACYFFKKLGSCIVNISNPNMKQCIPHSFTGLLIAILTPP